MTAHRIVLANLKGGVAKTTSAVNIGHGLAQTRRRTLIIDLDPQGHVATTLGLEKAPGIFNLIVEKKPIESVIVNARPNLDIVPSNSATARAKNYLATINFKETALKTILDQAEADGLKYDYIVMDCAPSFDDLQINALIAGHYFLVPTKLEFLSADGVNEITRERAAIESAGGHRIKFLGVLPTFYERVTTETEQQLRELVESFGPLVWPPVPKDARASEAPAYGQTLWEYCPSSDVIRGRVSAGNDKRLGGYMAVLKRLIDEVEGG
jgi:chromosome partitioning protein